MIYLLLADGFEIVEAMAPYDMLKRAKAEVKLIGVGKKEISASCGIKVIADDVVENINIHQKLEALILPGGMPGTLNLENSANVQQMIDKAYADGSLICAICAAPSILGHKGLLEHKEAICFPGFEEALNGAKLSDKYVCKSGNFITAKGAGVAIEFGLKIVEALYGSELAQSIRNSIQCNDR